MEARFFPLTSQAKKCFGWIGPYIFIHFLSLNSLLFIAADIPLVNDTPEYYADAVVVVLEVPP